MDRRLTRGASDAAYIHPHGQCGRAGQSWRVTDHPAPNRQDGRRGDGATAIEYGLIAAGIAVTIIGIVFIVGNDIAELFEAVGKKLKSKVPT